MEKDIQKPILYKAYPWVYAQIELQKEVLGGTLNRNKFINDAVATYLELVKLMQRPEFAYINEVSFNDEHLQRILYGLLRSIAYKYRPRTSHG